MPYDDDPALTVLERVIRMAVIGGMVTLITLMLLGVWMVIEVLLWVLR